MLVSPAFLIMGMLYCYYHPAQVLSPSEAEDSVEKFSARFAHATTLPSVLE
jgi:hypothetical protein